MADVNTTEQEHIEVVGADTNNLRNLDVRFPLGSISMVVGVSGSGKSSLLEDTLAREGQARLEALLGVSQDHLDEPTHRAYVGRLPATIHIAQRAFRASSRTTVGTASGFLSLLRRMFVRWSTPVSPRTGAAVGAPTADLYSQWMGQHHRGQAIVWAIPLNFVATDGRDMAARLRQLGFDRVVVRSETDSPRKWEQGKEVALERFKPLSPTVRHLVEVEIGQVEVGRKGGAARLDELLARAFAAGEGRVLVELPGHPDPALAGRAGPALDSRRHWVEPTDPRIYRSPSDHLLSFNSPEHEDSGACPQCKGLGRSTTVDLDSLVPHPERSMHGGAFSLWTEKNYRYVNIQHETIEGLRGLQGFDPDVPWRKLSDSARRLVLDGCTELVVDREPGTGRKLSAPRAFGGFRSAILERVDRGAKTAERLASLIGEGPCPSCDGSRWSPAASALKLGDCSIAELLRMDFMELADFTAPKGSWRKRLPDAAGAHVAQIHRLSRSFVGAGLGHLSGARGMLEVSEGEGRRIRLAAVLDGRHQGLCMLLDEPARGLHDEDVERLADTLVELRGAHTLVLNEHRRRLAAAADQLVELGPGAGPAGGSLVSAGPVSSNWWTPGPALERQRLQVTRPMPRLTIEGARINNVQDVDVDIPLNRLVCLTGVSGSGKSSFVRGVLVPALLDRGGDSNQDFALRRGRWRGMKGAEGIRRVVALDQQNPPANRRSTVATFLGLSELLRKHFAKLPSAKAADLDAGDFGLNAGDGRCSECLGIGKLEEHGRWVVCPDCGGVRFGAEVLGVIDDGFNLPQLLDRSITDLAGEPPRCLSDAVTLLRTADELGVGHLALARSLDTISGGELQRLRIARELASTAEDGVFVVLDEPAAGLHRTDVARLARALDRIVAGGRNTVVVVEHNLDLVAAADWIVEFGPGGGPAGGRVVATGTPEELRTTDTATGRMLRSSNPPKPRRAKPRAETRSATDAGGARDAREAAAVLRWLRRLLGDDVAPQDHAEASNVARPTVFLQRRKLEGKRLLEWGGLDRELSTLALGCHRQQDAAADAKPMLEAWRAHPQAHLVFHPLLRDIHVWGARIPASTYAHRRKRTEAQGFCWYDAEAIADVRAGGAKLGNGADRSRRPALLQEALMLGAGLVELRDGKRTIARYTSRVLDLERGIVGPMGILPQDLLRADRRGACGMCKGKGNIRAFETAMIIGDGKRPIEDRECLTGPALGILKGIHRNVLLPFFRRLTEEQLWRADVPIRKLASEELELLLYGFWSRPGPGSFLKAGNSKPNEVASWLRWDGLFAHVHAELSRAEPKWREAVEASERQAACPRCKGVGLKPHAELVLLAGRSFQEWMAQGTVRELVSAIRGLKSLLPREQRRRDRILACLAPLSKGTRGDLALSSSLLDAPWRDLGPAVVSAFSDMPTLVEEGG